MATPFRLYACLLAILMMAGAMPSSAFRIPPVDTDVVTAPLACNQGNPPGLSGTDTDKCAGAGTACDELRSAPDACKSGGCGSPWRTWDVEGGYKSGDGQVEFYVSCGTNDKGEAQKIADCLAFDYTECDDGPGDAKGTFGCFYAIMHGSPGDIWGKCVDPADPTAVFEAVPFTGQVYNMTAHRLPSS
jgi:hypothetical protein